MDNQKYRILSLDGGGSWALLQVMALQKMYGLNRHSYEVLNDFDLIVANSGGSLVAAAMAEGKPLNDILKLFMNETDRLNVFYKLKVWERDPVYSILRFMGIGPKYSAKKRGRI
jgi:patatin-like phospholipase/acyl hydrolase